MIKPIFTILKAIDNYLSYTGFLSKSGVLLMWIGIALTSISYILGIHVLMFIPAFVLSLFIYSFIDIQFAKKNINILWQNIDNDITLRIVFNTQKDYSFFKIVHKLNNDIKLIPIFKDISFNTSFKSGDYFFIIQGKLDIFRKIIKLPKRPNPNIAEYIQKNNTSNQDFYFNIRPYVEGDSVSRIDALNTSKRNKIYIREHISDIIRSKTTSKIIDKIKVIIRSNLYLTKRNDLHKGTILEWILISIGIIGIQLEWDNYNFLILSILSIFIIYLTNKKYKIPLFRKRKMNFWMFVIFSIFIFESIYTFDIVQSGVHFLVLVCILKHRFMRERRDAFTYIFLILFVFVALSFFALRIWFIILFIIYLLVAIGMFSIYSGGEIKQEYNASFGLRKNKLSYISMNIFVILFTITLFFVLPHGTKPIANTGLINKTKEAKTGFSDEVNLNSVSSIKKDFSKQFLIENASKNKIDEYKQYYWRGMRFYEFHNRKWYRNESEFIDFNRPHIDKNNLLLLNVKYFPNDNNAVFLPATPIYTEGPQISYLINDYSIARFTNKKNSTINETLYFLINTENQITDYSPRVQVFNKSIDQNTYILFKDFLESIPKDIINNPYKISDYIKYKAGLSYSLKNTSKDIQSFLYTTKKGHCEYFATVLAITLKYFGYRTTFVNGFHGGEFNELANTWIVRGEHAHSWVEILGKDNRWIRLDPTPDISIYENEFWFNDFNFIKRIIAYYDLIEYKWYNYIVQFSIIDQGILWRNIFKKLPIIIICIFIIISLIYFYKNYLDKTKHYLKLNKKLKFLYWLSKKSKTNFFILENLKTKFPDLSKKTQEIIYGNEYDKNGINKLKKEWKVKLKKKKT